MSLFDKIHAVAANANIWKSQMLFHGHVPNMNIFNPEVLCQSSSSSKTSHLNSLSAPSLHQICNYNQKHLFCFKNGDSFMFDPHMYPNHSKDTVSRLKADLIESARLSGFKLRYEGKNKLRINFWCDHNKVISNDTIRKFKDNKFQKDGTRVTTARTTKTTKKNSANNRKSSAPKPCGKNTHVKKRINTTSASCDANRCPFQLSTVFAPKEKVWYLRADCNDNIQDTGEHIDPSLHKGHYKVAPEHVKSDIISLSKEEINLALQCQDLFVDNSTIADLLELQRGGRMSLYQKTDGLSEI